MIIRAKLPQTLAAQSVIQAGVKPTPTQVSNSPPPWAPAAKPAKAPVALPAPVIDIKKEPGFAALDPDTQAAVLGAMTASTAPVLRDWLRSATFQLHGPTIKRDAIAGLARRPLVVAPLAMSPAFGALALEHKRVLLRLVASDTGYGVAARKTLTAMFADPVFVNASVDDQQERLIAFLSNETFIPPTTTAPAGTFTTTKPGALITGSAPNYNILIEGKTYPVTFNTPPSGKTHYTINEVADALAAVPTALRTTIDRVVLTAGPHPTVPTAYMGSNSKGVVEIYPGTAPLADSDFMASALVHETGHIISGKAWTDSVADPKWSAWKQAVADDVIHTSVYGASTAANQNSNGRGDYLTDDFAETIQLYHAAKGTPRFDALRKLFPARFAIIDKL